MPTGLMTMPRPWTERCSRVLLHNCWRNTTVQYLLECASINRTQTAGFSATVSRPLNGVDPFIFATRGTAGAQDLLEDTVLATTGYAVRQLVDGFLFLKQCGE